MDGPLDFLKNFKAAAHEEETWGGLRLQVRTYLTGELPPLKWVTSVRAIVRRGASILTVQDPDRVHILPGGRREAGESVDQTLQREILEETGWAVRAIALLGIKHFRHLSPKPEDYPYPYPDFLHLIYTAEAARYDPAARQAGGYELSAEFLPIVRVQALPLFPSERALLTQALAGHG